MSIQPKILERKYPDKEIVKFFSKAVWFYNLWASLTETKAQSKVIELANIKDGEVILDAAAGTCKLFEKLLKINSNGLNLASDISKEMLLNAKERLNNFKDVKNILLLDSVEHLSFKDETFDLILNNYMFDLMPVTKFTVVLKEFYRVLKPGGRIVISTMSFGSRWYNRFWYYLSKYFPKLLTGCRPISLKNYIADAGFNIQVSEMISQNTFPSEIIKATK